MTKQTDNNLFAYLDMCHSVVIEVAGRCKFLATYATLVRFLSTVDASMGI